MYEHMILVTGATGFIGKNLIPQLIKKNYKICCFVRKREDFKWLENLGVKIFLGDLKNKKDIDKVFEKFNFDTVIHLAAVIKTKNLDEFNSVNIEATRELVNQSEKSGVKKFIFTSTDFMYYPQVKNNYGESKRICEEIIKKSLLNFTILRAPPIYGKGDTKNLQTLFGLIKKNKIIPTMNCLIRPVYVGDVVYAIIYSITNNVTRNQIYYLPGGSLMTFKEMLSEMCKALKVKRIILPIPNELFKFMMKIYEILVPNPVLNYYQVAKLIINKDIDWSKSKKELKYKPITFREGLKLTLS